MNTVDCMQGADGSHSAISAKPVAMHVLPESIPDELKQYPQWVLWRSERDGQRWTKVPRSPRTRAPASVTNASTWGTFAEAVATYQGGEFDGIGFVLTRADPYSIIDIDNKPEHPATPEQIARHRKIYETFNSYTEYSPSGTGVHIVVKGNVPSGVRRDNVEVYSDARFMTFTGDRIAGRTEITEQQQWLDVLHVEMRETSAPVAVALEEHDDILIDAELVEMAMNAANADKFNQLCRGEWQVMGYPSQSEADFGLLSILCFYTLSNEQVRRIFRMTALGKRDKATRDDKYLNRALVKIRANEPPPVDLSALLSGEREDAARSEAMDTGVQENHPVIQPSPVVYPVGIEFPPGLVGEMANYIYNAAARPVPEIALAAAIALTAGVCGRAYNVSDTGLNQYVILLAKTGSGKEGARKGIEKLIAAVRSQIPRVDEFIGPAGIASGQALIKVFNEKPCFVSVLGEFGITLQQLAHPRANSAEKMLKRMLLDLYNQSGWSGTLRPTVYSDVTKNTAIVQAPNLTILGESTPSTFFGGLDATHIEDGLIPRFLVIEYKGERPSFNRYQGCAPSAALAEGFARLVATAISTGDRGLPPCLVKQDEAAGVMLFSFLEEADAVAARANSEGPVAELWNRAYQNAIKLAGLIAVGVNPFDPLITVGIADWAIAFVRHCVSNLTQRFKSGDIGSGDSKREPDIRKAVEAYLAMPSAQRLQYKVPKNLLDKPVVPFGYLRRRLRLLSAFKAPNRDPVAVLESAIRELMEAEILIQIPPQQAFSEFGTKMKLYIKGPAW